MKDELRKLAWEIIRKAVGGTPGGTTFAATFVTALERKLNELLPQWKTGNVSRDDFLRALVTAVGTVLKEKHYFEDFARTYFRSQYYKLALKFADNRLQELRRRTTDKSKQQAIDKLLTDPASRRQVEAIVFSIVHKYEKEFIEEVADEVYKQMQQKFTLTSLLGELESKKTPASEALSDWLKAGAMNLFTVFTNIAMRISGAVKPGAAAGVEGYAARGGRPVPTYTYGVTHQYPTHQAAEQARRELRDALRRVSRDAFDVMRRLGRSYLQQYANNYMEAIKEEVEKAMDNLVAGMGAGAQPTQQTGQQPTQSPPKKRLKYTPPKRPLKKRRRLASAGFPNPWERRTRGKRETWGRFDIELPESVRTILSWLGRLTETERARLLRQLYNYFLAVDKDEKKDALKRLIKLAQEFGIPVK